MSGYVNLSRNAFRKPGALSANMCPLLRRRLAVRYRSSWTPSTEFTESPDEFGSLAPGLGGCSPVLQRQRFDSVNLLR